MNLQILSESVRDIASAVVNLWGKAVDGVQNARERSLPRAEIIVQNLQKLTLAIQNTNTVPAELKRAVLLQQAIVAFAKRLTPVRLFSSAINATTLEGTDEVIVPFYDLETAASVDFDTDEGYQIGDTTTSSKKVTISKRKYQSMGWSSKELRRQPYLNLAQLARLKADKLGVDVFTDVLGLIVASSFPTVAHTGAAGDFDSDDVAALKLAAKTWPEAGRALVLDSAYDANLLKDAEIKSALASGSTDALREGLVGRELFGFDYNENPCIPTNAENLVGWISSPSCILFAQAPIGPTEEVMSQLTRYEVVTDPQTGVSFEYRLWGNADTDESREVIECNYGFAVGNPDALQRIRSGE